MKNTVIPAGYRVTITSWENDGDNYNTKILEGLTVQQAKFYVDFAKLFTKSGWEGGIGNLYEPNDQEIAKAYAQIEPLAIKHNAAIYSLNIFDADILTSAIDEGDAGEMLMELAYDIGLSCGEFWTRFCEEIKVEFVPREITFQDVTGDFV